MLIKKDPATIGSYFEDSSNLKGGYAEEVAIPEDVSELSAFLKEANSRKMPVTISGGGTATTGSRVPFGGAVLSTERLNRIIEVSADTMSVVVESGALVEDLKEACEKKVLFYTSHPTEPTARVGGTVATNASGARSFKYGPTRKYVKGLKMVLASGESLNLKRGENFVSGREYRLKLSGRGDIRIPIPTYRIPSVKNAAGYYAKDGMDLIDLFIGQEGTLSVITEIELGLVRMPEKIFSSFVFFRRNEDALNFADEARKSDALSIEYFDKNSLKLLKDKSPDIPSSAVSAIFFEQDTALKDEDRKIESWIKMIERHGASTDETWFATAPKDLELFNSFRHSIPESINDMVRRNGFTKLSTDIAVPAGRFREMVDFYIKGFEKSGVEHALFGHIGECHLHANFLPRSEAEGRSAKEACMAFARKGVSLGGTVSAEHGIGKIKHAYLEEMCGRTGILEMARVKKSLDPNCILGLDNMFPKEILKEV